MAKTEPIQTYAEPRNNTERELVRRLERLVQLECDRCAAMPPNAVPEPCNDCVTGAMRGRIRELEGEFHVEWLMNRWVGRCGHRWARLETKSPEQCPICELIAKGRPKGLVKRVAELSFYG
jgi:hypothetical protein